MTNLTDEQLAEIEAKAHRLRHSVMSYDVRVEVFDNILALVSQSRAFLDEVTALRHDVTRHMEIANEHLAEVGRLQSHITAARSSRVLNENGQADRHLSEATECRAKPSKMTVDVDNGRCGQKEGSQNTDASHAAIIGRASQG